MSTDDANERISISVRRLREWQWLATLSEDPDTVLCQLRQEAREMIEFGLTHPGNAKTIGKLVVAYHRLMVAVKERVDCNPASTAA